MWHTFSYFNPGMEAKSASPNAKKILVVDDNQVILKTTLQTLTTKGYQVTTATGGPEALSAIRKEKPDLILLDLTFPPDAANVGGPMQDGFFIIQWLRRTPETKDLPVIMISATDPEKFKDRALSSGVVASFHKPIDTEKLLAAIKTTLGQSTVTAG
ncbi:MAG TPA: response regulator [Candidatus Acidoferrum sp.]|nr:response regulator [Candidatus Acidoferrum sp.]